MAAILSKPFAHAGDADADAGPVIGMLRPPCAGDPTAPVPNLKDDLRRVTFERTSALSLPE